MYLGTVAGPPTMSDQSYIVRQPLILTFRSVKIYRLVAKKDETLQGGRVGIRRKLIKIMDYEVSTDKPSRYAGYVCLHLRFAGRVVQRLMTK